MSGGAVGVRVDAAKRNRLRGALAALPFIETAYLFGSVARGDAGPLSDIDVAVATRTAPAPEERMAVLAAVTGAIGRQKADVVFLHEATPALAFEVLRGEVLLAADEGARVEMEARIAQTWLDRAYYVERRLRWAAERMMDRGLA